MRNIPGDLTIRNKVFVLVYENNIDPWIPELWARESLAILEENMVAAALVNRDFENDLAQFGDVVNTRRPGEFEALRKTNADSVTVQDMNTTNVPVPLNQHIHVSFVVKDGEQSKSFQDLINIYLRPASLAMARSVDRIVLGQYPQFLANSYGTLGGMTAANGIDFILGTRKKMNINKAPVDLRNLILTPTAETTLLGLSVFHEADKVGDQGTALRNASLGRKLGFDTYMCQNMASVAVGNTIVMGEVNLAAGYAAGTTTMLVDGLSAALPVGSWFKVEGDGIPQQIISSVGGATPTSVTFTPGLGRAVLDNADITRYVPGTINFGAGYAAGYAKALTVGTFTVAPQVGQFVTFGTATGSSAPKYTIIAATGLTSITLDRPLESALVDTTTVNLGPAGDYNLAFLRNAMTLVVRPLAAPRTGIGAQSGVWNNRQLAMRATFTYSGTTQGTLVTLDFLAGIAILDVNQGAVMLA